MPPTKTISDWCPILARDEYVSVRGDYVSTIPSKTQLILLAATKNSDVRRQMTLRELQHHFVEVEMQEGDGELLEDAKDNRIDFSGIFCLGHNDGLFE